LKTPLILKLATKRMKIMSQKPTNINGALTLTRSKRYGPTTAMIIRPNEVTRLFRPTMVPLVPLSTLFNSNEKMAMF